MSVELEYLGVISHLWDWMGWRVAVTVEHTESRAYALEVVGVLSAQPAKPGDDVGRLYFALGDGCGFTLDERDFTSARLIEAPADSPRPGAVLVVQSGAIALAVSPLISASDAE